MFIKWLEKLQVVVVVGLNLKFLAEFLIYLTAEGFMI